MRASFAGAVSAKTGSGLKSMALEEAVLEAGLSGPLLKPLLVLVADYARSHVRFPHKIVLVVFFG